MLKKFAMRIVGENQNRICRDKFISKCINELPQETKILDAGAGQLRWRDACRNLTYVSQDFCQYDGTGDGKGIAGGGYGIEMMSIKRRLILFVISLTYLLGIRNLMQFCVQKSWSICRIPNLP